MLTRYTKHSFLLAALALLGACIACGSGGGGGGGGGEDSPESFRVIHGAPGASTLTVSIGEDPIEFFLDYTNITEYFEIPEGTVPIRVRTENDVLPSITANLTIAAGSTTTYLVTREAGVIEGTALPDNNEAPDPGLFKIRFINAAVASDKVTFLGNLPGQDADDADPIASEIVFKAASTYTSLDEGIYQFRARRSTSGDSLTRTQNIAFSAGEVITLVLVEDDDGGSPYTLIVLVDALGFE